MSINIKEIILPTGATLIYSKKEGNPFFSVSVGFRVGKVDENDNNRGISHLLEHMCFNGSKKYSKTEINEFPYKYGGYANASTSDSVTDYVVDVLKEYAEEALDFISQVTLYPKFPKDALEREKDIVIEEILEYKDSNDEVLFEATESLFHDERIKHPITGYQENIKKITRRDLVKFHKEFYNSNNMVISICSDLPVEKVVLLVNKYFKKIKGSRNTSKYLSKSHDGSIVLEKSEINQNLIMHNRLYDSKDMHKMFIISYIYGSDSSRLFIRLREELGLCYSVSSSMYECENIHYLSTFVGFSDTTKIDEIVDEINCIFEEMSQDITEEDLNIAKIQAKRNCLESVERSLDIAEFMPRQHFKGLPLNCLEEFEKINSVTLSDIKKLIRRLSYKDDYLLGVMKKN